MSLRQHALSALIPGSLCFNIFLLIRSFLYDSRLSNFTLPCVRPDNSSCSSLNLSICSAEENGSSKLGIIDLLNSNSCIMFLTVYIPLFVSLTFYDIMTGLSICSVCVCMKHSYIIYFANPWSYPICYQNSTTRQLFLTIPRFVTLLRVHKGSYSG